MTKLARRWTGNGLVFVCLSMLFTAQCQTLNTLVNFKGPNGSSPYFSSFAQGVDGAFYGTTESGRSGSCNDGCGTVFRVSSAGNLESVDLTRDAGSRPYAGVVLGQNQNFYGTTYYGGAYGWGTFFRITPAGLLTTMYSFCSQGFPCADGFGLFDGIIQGTDGNFYGTSAYGGIANDFCPSGCGTIFRVTPTGKLVTLYDFCGQPNCTDGAIPYGSLIEGSDGNFYGTTVTGGYSSLCLGGCGTVFKITPSGTLTTLYDFGGEADGESPDAGLVQASDGNFYGTTYSGGADLGLGTVFRLTRAGVLTTLYTFHDNHENGIYPEAALVQATDGNLYGTTLMGGASELGTIFEITLDGTFTTLHSFDSSDGANPQSSLLQATTGLFYGTTNEGGDNECNCGTLYSLDTGLGPFVTFVRAAGKVEQTGGILGQGFTGTTSVMLNGVPANFTVVSDTFIKATVPPGATTGYVTVTTPTGVLTSNVPFRVIP